MNLLPSVFLAIGYFLLALIITFLIFLLRIFIGKSFNSPHLPPVAGTVYHQLFHFKRLFHYHTGFAHRWPTYRLLALSHSEFYTVEPRNVEHILKAKFESYGRGEYNRSIMRDLFGEGIFAVDGSKWRQQRKLASFEFSTRVLRDYSCAVFRKQAQKLVQIVGDFAKGNQDIDAQDLLMKCALDSIFEVSLGVDLNCLGGTNMAAGANFIRAFDEANALVYWRYADFLWKIKRLLNLGSEARLKASISVIDNFIYDLILRKKEMIASGRNHGSREDILSRFLVGSEKDPSTITDKYIRDIILSFMIAGKDTTANTLSWFLYMICKQPTIQEKIAQQVREATEAHSIDEFVGKLTDETLDKMHYLHAAITETLRLYPAVPIDGKCAEADDVLPDGFRIKKGDGINYMAYAMGRMKEIWGEDAEEFKPERWLRNGIFQPESPFKFVTFHAGPRICLGKEFAYRQMKIVSMMLLRYFRFQLDDERMELKYRTMFTLHVDGGLPLRVFPRVYLVDMKNI